VAASARIQDQNRHESMTECSLQTRPSLQVESDDFEYSPFAERGGLGAAYNLFGNELTTLMNELNEVLAA